jgi:hypothetical protein
VLPQIFSNQGKLVQRSLQVLHDLGGDYVGRGEVGGVFQAVVLQTEDVEAGVAVSPMSEASKYSSTWRQRL